MNFGGIFTHTSLDVLTKEPSIIIVENLTSETGIKAFKWQKEYFGKAALHQSNEGSKFKGEYNNMLESHPNIKHSYSRPYKKNDPSFIKILTEGYEVNTSVGPNTVKKISQESRNE